MSNRDHHLTARPGVELRGFGYRKVANVAALPAANQQAGEIFDVGGALHYFDSAAAAWVPVHQSRIYPFLRQWSPPNINPAILRETARGSLKVGDVIVTTAYYDPALAGRDLGGCAYRVVAAGTGTDDGGSFINAGTLQLRAIVGTEIRISQFGVRPQTGQPSLDSATAIQNAINAAAFASPAGATLGGGRVFFDLWARIDATLLVDNSSTWLMGFSGHNFYGGRHGSGLLWGGTAGLPMIEFRDCNGGGVDNMVLVGNSTSPPIGIRHSFGNNAPGQGQSIAHRDLRIGWHPAVSGGSGSVEKGIEIAGLVDLDRWFLDNVEIHGVTDCGIDVINPQATWNLLSNVLVNNRIAGLDGTGTAIRTQTDINLVNFNPNGIGLVFDVNAGNVTCDAIGSENCVKFADIAPGSKLQVNGGYCDVNAAPLNTPFVTFASTGSWGRLGLNQVDFRSFGNVWPTGVTFQVGNTQDRNTNGPRLGVGRFSVRECPAIPFGAIDISPIGVASAVAFEWDNNGHKVFQYLRPGETLSLRRYDVSSSGTTAQRPLEALVGQSYFDTSLTPPRMIVWNGSAWVNVDGTAL